MVDSLVVEFETADLALLTDDVDTMMGNDLIEVE